MTTNKRDPSPPTEEEWNEIVLTCFKRLGRSAREAIATSRLLSFVLWTLPEAKAVWLGADESESAIVKALERLREGGKVEVVQLALWRVRSEERES